MDSVDLTDMAASARRSPVRAIGLLVALGLTVSVLLPVGARADNRPTVAEVQANLDQLEQSAADAAEALKGTRSVLADVSSRVETTKLKIAAARQEVTTTDATIDDMARSAYTSEGGDGLMDLLTASSPEQFLHQMATWDALQQRTTTRLASASTATARLRNEETDLKTDLAIAAAATVSAGEQRAAIATSITEGVTLIANLRAEERAQLLALQEAQRQAQNAAAASARIALPNVAATGPARIAIEYALSQVGKPYSLNANPPTSWDCSKLTAAAWALAGVTLNAYSFTQFDQTDRVAQADILPGDLLFYFGLGAHHVVIYIGNGMAVSASNPGRGVEVLTDPFGGWYGQRYSGAGRVRLAANAPGL